MEKVNDLISKNPIHLTTNTIILIVVAIVAFYIVMKAIEGIVKIIAILGVCYFALMSIQSTNLINVPVIKETYATIEKIIPSKELWTDALNKADKINKVVNDLK
ncbi:hypothetical protein [Clostridium saccharobutylicum]|uniref:Uncharacterized protein n=1 Tax=Clostridium saccharobutylicum DSM 13864 TaxID=1345695 RepID=U5MPI5_CLOSA|nr:hypothetical protein [Clostridium saccharobutylicum]AGX42480.1 hypothetical protein CLSA_c14800 [Clostridium saccharobutylicum DSM 13864]AQR89765.1 hypothetical protein CLOSC_14680 [Clostridium saccharobutylicum]AQR99667.1 hypothetical protein CSACC_14760 [Clostridium saccharobutylicum]AQS09398.1 hypothetical protein CLOBY_15250 [Clostridium saccharobutylicum]AQS13653.1 hypothetical protein CLOSACC_14760 [Clostridium saccharobutylicum]